MSQNLNYKFAIFFIVLNVYIKLGLSFDNTENLLQKNVINDFVDNTPKGNDNYKKIIPSLLKSTKVIFIYFVCK
jgi:hypothetical protein